MTKKRRIQPRGWKYSAAELREKFESYIKEVNEAQAEYPTQKGDVLRYNKPRVPNLNYFVNHKLNISRNTFRKWYDGTIVRAHEERIGKEYDQNRHERALELESEAKFIKEAFESLEENALVNGDGSTAGLTFKLRARDRWNPNQEEEKKVEPINIRS
jgi:hypothetical protein